MVGSKQSRRNQSYLVAKEDDMFPGGDEGVYVRK